MKKNKLLVFHPALAPYRVDFFNALNNAFDASFYFNSQNLSNQKFDQKTIKRKCDFTLKFLPIGFDFWGRSIKFGIFSIIRKEKPEIVICSEYSPVTLVVFLYRFFLRYKFRLYTISDDSIDNSKARKGLRSLVRNIISRNIDGVIFPSQEVCKWYQINISNKTKALELPIIHCDQVFRKELTNSINYTNKNIDNFELAGQKVLLFVGRLVEEKNISFLINVVSQIKSENWKLIIVGDGTIMDDLTTKVKQLNMSDKIIFIGRKEGVELVSWYNIAQLFILPSTFEPFGAVTNEALLGGCKVLCSDLAGSSSLINNSNGQLFSPYKEDELLTCLIDFLKVIEITPTTIEKIRESKMPFLFKDKMKLLIDNL